MINFLSIDCSTDVSSLFIKFKTKTFSKVLQSYKFNNDLLAKEIIDFILKNGLEFNELSQIFINQGPGNFSSLRASLAIAKGFSISKKLKLFGYNTFLWSSVKYFSKNESIFCLVKIRNKYFIKNFDKNLNVILEAKEISMNELLEKYNNKFKVIPKFMIKHFDEEILKLDNINIANLDHKDLEFLLLKGLLNNDFVKPVYLS